MPELGGGANSGEIVEDQAALLAAGRGDGDGPAKQQLMEVQPLLQELAGRGRRRRWGWHGAQRQHPSRYRVLSARTAATMPVDPVMRKAPFAAISSPRTRRNVASCSPRRRRR